MLRKIGYITLATLLILTTVGFVISRHYCENELVSISVDLPADNCCEEMADNCCHNENETFILKVDFTQPVGEQNTIAVHDLFESAFVELFCKVNTPNLVENTVFDHRQHESSGTYLELIQSFLL
jgi:hypothetical protein